MPFVLELMALSVLASREQVVMLRNPKVASGAEESLQSTASKKPNFSVLKPQEMEFANNLSEVYTWKHILPK